MIELNYTLHFNTPAFLGNAEQSAQWRTPPIKALLRQWWRVAYAADCGFKVDVPSMRRDEALLFGHAWLENDSIERNGRREKTAARKSQVRVRLSSWEIGKLTAWVKDSEKVDHPEVKSRVCALLYLGYGPLIFKDGTKLKANAAIQAQEEATLSLAVPAEHAARIKQALWLMERYGTLGGRSRNGWGSFTLMPEGNTPALGGELPLCYWQAALSLDWPHAIGRDDRGPLIWQTDASDNWRAVMRQLAEIKIGLRRKFVFTTGKNASRPEDRHWLSYPVTNHSVQPWGNNARLPNTLRFKVRPTADGKLVGVIFHVPHKPPAKFQPREDTLKNVWRRVHEYLDQQPAEKLKRVSE